MFSIGPKPSSDVPYGHGKQRGLPPFARGREVQTLFMAIVGLALVGVLASIFMDLSARTKGQPQNLPEIPLDDLQPMAVPTFDDAPPLPSAEAVQAVMDQATFLKNNLQAFRPRDLDPLTIAWAKIQLTEDRLHPPVPQRFDLKDLMQHQVRHGTNLVVTGTVLFTKKERIGDEEWVRLVCELNGGERQFIQGLAAPGTPYIEDGRAHYLVGRYAGTALLPAEVDGMPERLPVIVVREAALVETVQVETLLDLPTRDRFTRFVPDPKINEDINDAGTVLEYRPYYQLLGQVSLDVSTPGAFDAPGDANQMAGALHLDPAQYRDQVFTVEGKVYQAWEDPLVRRDTPYGVQRVFRIWLGNYEWNDRHAHVYEVAAIVGREAQLPVRGDLVRATGRFLKVQGYRVNLNFMRDMANEVKSRKSNNAYFKFFVCPGFEIRPKPVPRDWLWVKVAFSIISFSLVICMVVMINNEQKHQDDVKKPLRRLREGRRHLKTRDRGVNPDQEEDPGGADGAEDDPDDAPDTLPAIMDDPDRTGAGEDGPGPTDVTEDDADRKDDAGGPG